MPKFIGAAGDFQKERSINRRLHALLAPGPAFVVDIPPYFHTFYRLKIRDNGYRANVPKDPVNIKLSGQTDLIINGWPQNRNRIWQTFHKLSTY
jgi:hypothetical protein